MNEYVKKVTIIGEYYDTYLYRGNILMIGYDKKVNRYKWDDMIKSIITEDKDELAYKCAFLNSNYLYKREYQEMFDDNEIKNLLLSKFKRISNFQFPDDISEYKINQLEGEFKYLPTDIGVYNDKLYYCDSDGFYSRTFFRNRRSKYPLSSRPVFLDEREFVSLDIKSGGYVMLSGLNQGLWEYNIFYDRFYYDESFIEKVEGPIKQISKEHNSFISRNYSSYLAGSYTSSDYFYTSMYDNSEKRLYYKNKVLLADIFETSTGFFISGDDKIYQIYDNGINLVEFKQYQAREDKEFNVIGKVFAGDMNISNLITASVELFGIVLEYRNAFKVILSDDSVFEIRLTKNQKIVNWRTFPRSNNYENQLHLILDDRIEVISFNYDYFVNQESKRIGKKFLGTRRGRTNRI